MIINHLLRIEGRVQGVCFRASLQAEAKRLQLTGWVRNRRDGTVEALVRGPAAAVEALEAWAHTGPPGATVSAVLVSEADPAAPLPAAFERHPTL